MSKLYRLFLLAVLLFAIIAQAGANEFELVFKDVPLSYEINSTADFDFSGYLNGILVLFFPVESRVVLPSGETPALEVEAMSDGRKKASFVLSEYGTYRFVFNASLGELAQEKSFDVVVATPLLDFEPDYTCSISDEKVFLSVKLNSTENLSASLVSFSGDEISGCMASNNSFSCEASLGSYPFLIRFSYLKWHKTHFPICNKNPEKITVNEKNRIISSDTAGFVFSKHNESVFLLEANQTHFLEPDKDFIVSFKSGNSVFTRAFSAEEYFRAHSGYKSFYSDSGNVLYHFSDIPSRLDSGFFIKNNVSRIIKRAGYYVKNNSLFELQPLEEDWFFVPERPDRILLLDNAFAALQVDMHLLEGFRVFYSSGNYFSFIETAGKRLGAVVFDEFGKLVDSLVFSSGDSALFLSEANTATIVSLSDHYDSKVLYQEKAYESAGVVVSDCLLSETSINFYSFPKNQVSSISQGFSSDACTHSLNLSHSERGAFLLSLSFNGKTLSFPIVFSPALFEAPEILLKSDSELLFSNHSISIPVYLNWLEHAYEYRLRLDSACEGVSFFIFGNEMLPGSSFLIEERGNIKPDLEIVSSPQFNSSCSLSLELVEDGKTVSEAQLSLEHAVQAQRHSVYDLAVREIEEQSEEYAVYLYNSYFNSFDVLVEFTECDFLGACWESSKSTILYPGEQAVYFPKKALGSSQKITKARLLTSLNNEIFDEFLGNNQMTKVFDTNWHMPYSERKVFLIKNHYESSAFARISSLFNSYTIIIPTLQGSEIFYTAFDYTKSGDESENGRDIFRFDNDASYFPVFVYDRHSGQIPEFNKSEDFELRKPPEFISRKIIDNNDQQASVFGAWASDFQARPFIGIDYLSDLGVGKQNKKVMYRLLAEEGTYNLYINTPSSEEFSARVPVLIDASESSSVVFINQREEAGWAFLGRYRLDKGSTVSISALGTEGIVVADAVMLERQDFHFSSFTFESYFDVPEIPEEPEKEFISFNDSIRIQFLDTEFFVQAEIRAQAPIEKRAQASALLHEISATEDSLQRSLLKKKLYQDLSEVRKNVKIKNPTASILEITFNDLVMKDNVLALGIEDLELPQRNAVRAFAIDPEALDFTNGTVKAIAQGDALYKCKDWAFEQRACEGEWELIMSLVPGQEYEIYIDPHDPAFYEVVSTCAGQELSAARYTFSEACTPSNLLYEDTNIESFLAGKAAGGSAHRWGGIRIQSVNTSITNCDYINDVFICYKWWRQNTNPNECYISVSDDGGSSFTDVVTACPGTSEPTGYTCLNITADGDWGCGNFFNTTGTRAVAISQMARGGAAGASSGYGYWDVFYFNVTYTEIDNISPSVTIHNPRDGRIYTNTTLLVNISATDNRKVDSIWFNWNGIDVPYTTPTSVDFDEGYITLIAYANDTSGNINSTNITFEVNTRVPFLEIESPEDGKYYNYTNILLNITAREDNVTLDKVWYNWNGTNITYTNTTSIEFNEGSNTLHAWANNSLGNTNYRKSVFTVDTTPPTLEIIMPRNSTYLTRKVLLNLSYYDENLDAVWYSWRGTNYSYSGPINLTSVQGSNFVQAWARDFAGNVATREVSYTSVYEIQNIVTDCAAQTYSAVQGRFTDPCDDPTGEFLRYDDALIETHNFGKSGGSPRYGGVQIRSVNTSIEDCDSIDQLQFCYKWWRNSADASDNCVIRISNNSGSSFANIVTTCPGTSEPADYTCVDITSLRGWTCDHFFNTSGTRAVANSEIYTSGVGGHDVIGNWDVFFFNISYNRKDVRPPTIDIISPESRVYNYSTILVNISADDDWGLDYVWYNWNGTNITYTNETYVTFEEGFNTLHAWAIDTSENLNYTNVTFDVDTTPPDLEILSPLNTTYYNRTILVNISVADRNLDSVWYNWNGTDYPYTGAFEILVDEESTNTLHVWANDTVGNLNYTNVTFTHIIIHTYAVSPANGTVLDRDSLFPEPDQTDLIVQINGEFEGLEIFFYSNLTHPDLAHAKNVLLGSALTNASGYATFTFNPNSSIYAGNHAWWGRFPPGIINTTRQFYVYGGANLVFSEPAAIPNPEYNQTESLYINATVNSLGPESISELVTYYSPANFYSLLQLTNSSEVNLSLSEANGFWTSSLYEIPHNAPLGYWNATLGGTMNYFAWNSTALRSFFVYGLFNFYLF
ncbi:MAG TPA: hypothetical protein ENN46_01455, partial [Candidatus Woesearchaeota archaeon]|nr:hypothetical protein [Candidatus Woesearchaeota archaeon]